MRATSKTAQPRCPELAARKPGRAPGPTAWRDDGAPGSRSGRGRARRPRRCLCDCEPPLPRVLELGDVPALARRARANREARSFCPNASFFDQTRASPHKSVTAGPPTNASRQRLPRYTSYPTAPQFGAQLGEAEYRAWLADLPEGLTGSSTSRSTGRCAGIAGVTRLPRAVTVRS